MNTNPVTAETLSRSVVAVPPLAREDDLSLNRSQNAAIIRHLESGGVSTLLYGGNANLYNVAVSEYPALLEMLAQLAGADTVVIPSVGPAYGTMMDQAPMIRAMGFATAMGLPPHFASTASGVATGVRRFVEAAGVPVVLYIKHESMIDVAHIKKLFEDEVLSVIKYAIVREDVSKDDYLRRLIDAVDPKRIMSGIGEQPAIVHLRDFGLGGFTSGCVCVAPRLSTAMLRAMQRGDYAEADRIRNLFRPLEDLRNAISPIRVLHEAVRLADVADTGPILPLLSNLERSHHEAVAAAAGQLVEHESAAVRTG